MSSKIKSARELKLKNFVKGKISLYSSKVSNISSRNQSNPKCGKSNKIIKDKIKKKKKLLEKKCTNHTSSNVTKNDALAFLEKRMFSNLKRHDSNITQYNIKTINDIIYDERKHIVCVFKNYLLWDETSDFLKRFYLKHESTSRLPKITGYYEKYTLFPPVYFGMEDVVKIMLKNVKRKKKYLEMIEENEDNANNCYEKKIDKEFNCIINPNEVNDFPSASYINSKDGNIFSSPLPLPSHTAPNCRPVDDSFGELNQLMNFDFKENFGEISSFLNGTIKDNNNTKSLFDLTRDEKETISSTAVTRKKKNTLRKYSTNIKTHSNINNPHNCNTNPNVKKGRKIEIKKLDLRNINLINIDNTELNTTKNKNFTDRNKQRNRRNSNSKEHITYTTNRSKQKPKTNLVIQQKSIMKNKCSTNRNKMTPQIKFNSLENMLRLIQYPKTNATTHRVSSVSQTKNKTSKKIKSNLVIQPNSSSIKTKRNTSTSINKKKCISTSAGRKAISHRVTITNPGLKANNKLIIPATIYNINLNLNLGSKSKQKTQVFNVQPFNFISSNGKQITI